MLTNADFLKGLTIHGTDGELGTVAEFYFDDKTWAIRYLVVETGGWLNGSRVLISPMSVIQTDWPAKHLDVALTKSQISHSPGIDTHVPVSRQHEVRYLGYYGYPYYWGGPYLWGASEYPWGGPLAPPTSAETVNERMRRESADSHLRSSDAVKGYHVAATDGGIGHIDGYIVDDRDWRICYFSVATRNWLPGKKVLVAPVWATEINWLEMKVRLELSKNQIETAPEYLESIPLDRHYEQKLHDHYGRAPYWLGASGRAA